MFLEVSPKFGPLVPLCYYPLPITYFPLPITPVSHAHRQLLLLTLGSPLQDWIALDREVLPQTSRFRTFLQSRQGVSSIASSALFGTILKPKMAPVMLDFGPSIRGQDSLEPSKQHK